MSKVLIERGLLEKAVRRFLARPQADIVPFDRIPGQKKSHFAIAGFAVTKIPKTYVETAVFEYKGEKYQVFLQPGFVIENR